MEAPDRELVTEDDDMDRLCPAKKWGLTSNDETIGNMCEIVKCVEVEVEVKVVFDIESTRSLFGRQGRDASI